MLSGLDVGEGEGAGADWAGPRGAVVGLTGIGGVRALMGGPWIKIGGSGSGSAVLLARPWAEGRVLG